MRVFEPRRAAEPRITIDRREIVAARFVTPETLPAAPGLARFTREHLAPLRATARLNVPAASGGI